ncbi:MAG: SGNH/GDSL hydrolase family protein, partial [Kamptonema sp. SIO4C4]|nr:SGNH/GDSL hydrolase family protein [Kamptonema sp. SIO4C4]
QNPEEQQIVQQLGEEYQTKVKQGFTRLGEVNDTLGSAFPQNIRTLNYYTLYNDLSAVAFRDPIHLTNDANQAIAERFYNAVTRLPELQVVSQTPEQ